MELSSQKQGLLHSTIYTELRIVEMIAWQNDVFLTQNNRRPMQMLWFMFLHGENKFALFSWNYEFKHSIRLGNDGVVHS